MWNDCQGAKRTAAEIVADMEKILKKMPDTPTIYDAPKLRNYVLSTEMEEGMLIHRELWAAITTHGSVQKAIANGALSDTVKASAEQLMGAFGTDDISHGVHDEFIVECKTGNGTPNNLQLDMYMNTAAWAKGLPLGRVFGTPDTIKPLTKKQRAESYISTRTTDELEDEVSRLRTFVVDVLLPAKFQEKPNTWLRAKLVAVKKSGIYNDQPVVAGAINTALKKALVVQYMDGVFAEIIAAVENGKELPRE